MFGSLINKYKVILGDIVLLIKKSSKNYYTCWYRPVFTLEIDNVEQDFTDNVVIMMQGPISKENDFTLETLRLYKKKFPNCQIVLSTWVDEPEDLLKEIEKIGCDVVLSSPPEKLTGYSKNELQRISSSNGIKRALKYNPEFILKTRTDQRIYENKSLEFLINMYNLFPLKIKSDAKGRLLVCSMCTFTNRLYNLSDMFIFGKSDDVLRYYSCPSDNRENTSIFIEDQIAYSKIRPGEIYFASHYIESLGYELKWTIEDSIHYIKELFMIVDNEMIDLFWPKHSNLEYRWRRYNKGLLKQLTFKDWLNLQNSDI